MNSVIDEVVSPCRLKFLNGALALTVKNYGTVTSVQKCGPDEVGDNYDIYKYAGQTIRCSKAQSCYLFKFAGNDTIYLYKFLTCPGRLFNHSFSL